MQHQSGNPTYSRLLVSSEWDSDTIAMLCVLLRTGCNNVEIGRQMNLGRSEIAVGVLSFGSRAWPGKTAREVAALRLQAATSAANREGLTAGTSESSGGPAIP